MRRWMYCAFAAVLTGCGGPPVTVEHTTITICPSVPVSDVCPPFPVLGEQVPVEAVEDAWIEAQKVYRECSVAVDEWQSAWQGCQE